MPTKAQLAKVRRMMVKALGQPATKRYQLRRGCPKPPKPHQFGVLVIPANARVRGRGLVKGGDDCRPQSERAWTE